MDPQEAYDIATRALDKINAQRLGIYLKPSEGTLDPDLPDKICVGNRTNIAGPRADARREVRYSHLNADFNKAMEIFNDCMDEIRASGGCPMAADLPQEKVIWRGKTSQWINAKRLLITLLFCWVPLVNLALFIWLIVWVLRIYCREYIILEDKIVVKKGILNKYSYFTYNYRVTDVTVFKPLIWNIVGFGGLLIFTSEDECPVVPFECIRDVDNLATLILSLAEKSRGETPTANVQLM